MDQTNPSPARARAQLRGKELVSAIAGAGARVVYIDDDQRPLAAVLPIALWKLIAAIPYYRAITESYSGVETSETQLLRQRLGWSQADKIAALGETAESRSVGARVG